FRNIGNRPCIRGLIGDYFGISEICAQATALCNPISELAVDFQMVAQVVARSAPRDTRTRTRRCPNRPDRICSRARVDRRSNDWRPPPQLERALADRGQFL